MSLPAELTGPGRDIASMELDSQRVRPTHGIDLSAAEIRAIEQLALLELKNELDRAVARGDYQRARMYAFALAARLRRVKLARAAA